MAGVLAGLIVAFFALLGIVYAAVRVPLPAAIALPQQVRLTYTDGTTLDTIGKVDRTDVPITDIPVPVQEAVLAAEDRNFYHESGVSVRGIGRALVADVSGGGIKQGGSTITQQYAKNAYTGQSRTFTRKIKEVVLAVKLARKYSKPQILDDYLNTIYFGRNSYGIEAASQAYFGKPVRGLSAAQGAVLAGLIRQPSYLDPRLHPQASRDRWQQVIDTMESQGWLTPAQHDSLAYPTTISPRSRKTGTDGPTSYIDAQVDSFLRARLGDDVVNLGGLRVTTTIDKSAQAAAVKAVADHTQGAPADLRVGLVSTDPRTGAIRAYFGGAKPGEADAVSFLNPAPGSSFKPITLATALANGIPLTKTYDGSSPQTFNGTSLKNFGAGQGEQFGYIDLPTATANSVNTVYLQLARDAGPTKVVALAHALGVPANVALDPSPEIALGTTGVRPIDMAKVYDAFANRGNQFAPYLVQKVADRKGHTLFSAAPQAKQALAQRVADDTTYAMQQVLTRGTAANFQLAGGRPAAGKTGTVSGDVAAWFDGYTPQLSTVVGVSEPSTSNGGKPQTIQPYGACGCTEVTGATAGAPIWQDYMNAALAGQPVLQFPPPQDITPSSSAPPPPPVTTAPFIPPSTTSAPPTLSSAPPTMSATAPPSTTTTSSSSSSEPVPPSSSTPITSVSVPVSSRMSTPSSSSPVTGPPPRGRHR